MQATAKLNYARISPQKARLVVDLVRGRRAGEALSILKMTKKRAAGLVGKVLQSATESGTTANRPTVELWIGRRYFDTTLGHPVYLKSVRPSVWVDGTGSAV